MIKGAQRGHCAQTSAFERPFSGPPGLCLLHDFCETAENHSKRQDKYASENKKIL